MITLVLGGTRSGKSAVAETLATRHPPPVTYVATMVRSGDPDLEARVAAHRGRRDITWETVEPGGEPGLDLVATLALLKGSVLVDSLGPWVGGAGPGVDGVAMGAALAGALRDRTGDTVVVAEEVGMSVHPTTVAGRRFQDALGAVSGAVSAVADRAYLVVAGRVIELPRPRGPHVKRALSFLTVLGRAERPDARTLSWFPVVGFVVGALVGCAWWAADRVWPTAVAALIAVGVDAAVTGCLHLDGLADAADGLMVAVDRPRRLEIMADPRVGVFGAVALVVVLGLRATAFGVMTPRPLFVMGIWCGSRTIMAVVARSVPYAHEEGGTASAFLPGSRSGPRFAVACYGMGVAGALAAAGAGWRGLAALVVEIVAALSVVWLSVRRLGGFTGDVLGAAGVVGETAALLALAVR